MNSVLHPAASDTPAILDCGHTPDPGHPAQVMDKAGKVSTVQGWQFVIRDGRKICHACDSKRVLSCGHHPSPHAHFTTGTAHTSDGREICYSCADAETREEMKTARVFCAYVSGDWRTLQTWSGGHLGTVTRGSRHPWSRERNYIRVTDCHGNRWHGTGGNGMWASLRRCK